jgi:hypothetical protein
MVNIRVRIHLDQRMSLEANLSNHHPYSAFLPPTTRERMSKREEGNRIWKKYGVVTGAVSGTDDLMRRIFL